MAARDNLGPQWDGFWGINYPNEGYALSRPYTRRDAAQKLEPQYVVDAVQDSAKRADQRAATLNDPGWKLEADHMRSFGKHLFYMHDDERAN